MEVNRNFPARRKGERDTADTATNLVADYVAQHGISRAALARGTGLSEGILRRSLSARTRSLRADEFLAVCRFLDKSPLDFAAKQPAAPAAVQPRG